MHCVRSVVKVEGLHALYVGLPTALMMNIPYGIVMVPVNESAKKFLNPLGKYNFSVSMIAGSIAGGIAAAVTNPLDVIKTRLQTQGNSGLYTSSWDCVKKLIAKDGLFALTNGMTARILWLAPNVAITMTVYESIKKIMFDSNKS